MIWNPSSRCGRPPLCSPGRPSVAARDDRQRFWTAVASGLASEGAAIRAGVSQAVGTRWFRETGGMPPSMFGSSAKPFSGRYLALAEREGITLLRVQGHFVHEIARRLDRAASTVSRELRRNTVTQGGYRATTAQWHADRSARRPNLAKLVINVALRNYVQGRLAGLIAAPDGAPVRGPAVAWRADGMGHSRFADGPRRGAPSKSLAAWP